MKIRFLLVWSSGHRPKKPVYYQKLGRRSWNGTYDRDQATSFPTPWAALDCWRGHLAFPEDYEQFISNGEVRAEREDQLTLCL